MAKQDLDLQIFNSENTDHGMTYMPTIRIYSSGRITLNKEAMRLLGLDNNRMVEFAQDKKEPQNWYIFKSDKVTKAFELKTTAKMSGVYLYSKDIFKKILESIKKPDVKAAAFLISETKTQFNNRPIFPIIVSSFRAVGRKTK